MHAHYRVAIFGSSRIKEGDREYQEVYEIARGNHTGHYSCGRTCELGMETATGKPYASFIALVEQATRTPSAG